MPFKLLEDGALDASVLTQSYSLRCGAGIYRQREFSGHQGSARLFLKSEFTLTGGSPEFGGYWYLPHRSHHPYPQTPHANDPSGTFSDLYPPGRPLSYHPRQSVPVYQFLNQSFARSMALGIGKINISFGTNRYSLRSRKSCLWRDLHSP